MDRIGEKQLESKSESRILQILREQGESSIAELARLSGLGKATASRAIQSLRSRGLVEDTGDEFRRLSTGRAGRAIRIRPDAGLYLGIALSSGSLTAVVADAAKRVVAWRRESVDLASGNPMPKIASVIGLADRILAIAGCDRERLSGVGVSVAAPVDPVSGTIGHSVMVPEWTGSSPHKELAAHFGKQVLLDNDANCSALAELLWGDLNSETTAVLLRLDQGVGGSLVHKGEILHGHTGRAGDYGHVTHDPHGPECQCGGRGCFEHYLSIPAVEFDLGDTIANLGTRAGSGDIVVLESIRRKGSVLGYLAAVVSRTVDPDRIFIGGGLLALGPGFLNAANETLHMLNSAAPPIETAIAATVLDRGSLHDEPALGAIGLLIRQDRSTG